MTNGKCPVCGKPKKESTKTCGNYSCMGVMAHRTRKSTLGSHPSALHTAGRRRKKGKKYVQKTLDRMLNQLDIMREKILFLKEKNLR